MIRTLAASAALATALIASPASASPTSHAADLMAAHPCHTPGAAGRTVIPHHAVVIRTNVSGVTRARYVGEVGTRRALRQLENPSEYHRFDVIVGLCA